MNSKIIRLEENRFGLDSYDIDMEINGKLYVGILISKERLDKKLEVEI